MRSFALGPVTFELREGLEGYLRHSALGRWLILAQGIPDRDARAHPTDGRLSLNITGRFLYPVR